MRVYQQYTGGPWWCDFSHNGRRTRQSTGTTDKTAAKEYAERLKASFWRQARLGERSTVDWDTAVLDWIKENQHLASLSDRKDQLRWASRYLAGKPLTEIDAACLIALARKKTNVAAATVNRHLAAISAVLHYAHKHGWIAAVPAIPRRKETAIRFKFATEEQAKKLIAALPPEWAVMVEFSLMTGLRRHNVTHLQWSAVDLAKKVAWVHADEAKGAKVIPVPLSNAAVALLLQQQGKHLQYVFPGQRATPVERIGYRMWNAACKEAGLVNFKWHDLRHTWASWHVQRGTPLPVLQQLGGWQSLSMVMRYAHLAPDHIAAYAGNGGLEQKTA